MMFDSQDRSPATTAATAFEPLGRSQTAKRNLRGKSGALLTSTGMIAAASALTLSGEALAQGVPAGFAPAPADVISYVQLSNGSVLVQLANQQSLLVTTNNFFIDGGGVLYLSPSVVSGIAGGGAAPSMIGGGGMTGLPAPTVPTASLGTTSLGSTSSGVIFDDTAAAASSGGILGTVTGGPGLFGLGTLGTIAAIGLGGGAILLAANAIRSRLGDDEPEPGENQAATLDPIDDKIEKGETGGTLTYAISDQDGIDESDLIASIEAGLGGASTIASIFPEGAEVTTERSGSGLVEGTEDTYRSINVTLTGDVAAGLNVGEFTGPAVTFNDATGNEETVNFGLNISEAGGDGGSGGGGEGGDGTLELSATDGGTYNIAQGGTRDFSATDPDGDPIQYDLTSNTSGFGINQAGQVVVASSVPVGLHSITVTATSKNGDGTEETDVETYNINVTAGSGGSAPVNTVNADFDSLGAGFNTLNGIQITGSSIATNSDDKFEVPKAADLVNNYIIDGLAGNDTLYFSEFGATYHFDPIDKNSFEDVSGFETLVLMSDVDLEINGGVLDSTQTGDIEHIQGSGDNVIRLVNQDADMGMDVSLTNIDRIETGSYDLTLDYADLEGVNSVKGDTQSTLIFTGQFSYDFADNMLETEDVTRIGLDGGNYSYALTLDGVNDEDVREISAVGEKDLTGDVLLDTRLNPKVTRIDLRGDDNTSGGLDGASNIFATYDDTLEILGGQSDDDVELFLESDVEDKELIIDLGAGNADTLNINLNGDEVDTLGFGRSIKNVEIVDIDAPNGDGEAHMQFDGSVVEPSTLKSVDMSDLSEDGSIVLKGDLSNTNAQTAVSIEGAASATIFAASDVSVFARRMLDGFVANDDVEIHLTPGDDMVDLVIGESEYTVTLGATPTNPHQVTMAQIATVANVQAGQVTSQLSDVLGGGSAQEVDIHLGGGDDRVSLELGSLQEADVTLHVSRADSSDHDTITFTSLEDYGALADNASTIATTAGFGQADGLVIDFEDDITSILADTDAVDANSVNINNSEHGALLVFGMSANAVQRGMIFDHDGDGELSDGDTLLDFTSALMAPSGINVGAGTAIGPIATNTIIDASSSAVAMVSQWADLFTFNLVGGDLEV